MHHSHLSPRSSLANNIPAWIVTVWLAFLVGCSPAAPVMTTSTTVPKYPAYPVPWTPTTSSSPVPSTATSIPSPTSLILTSTPTLPPTLELALTSMPAAQPAPVTCGWPPERVLVINIDGLRPDAITDTVTAPFLWDHSLQGAYTWDGLTTNPSLSMTAYTSMLTGYDVDKHGAIENSLWQTPEAKVIVPSVFQRAKERGLSTVLISGKKHLDYIYLPAYVDFMKIQKTRDKTIVKIASDYIKKNDFDLMFINLASVGETGVESSWMSPAYMKAVSGADKAVRSIFDNLRKKGILDSTLVILNSNHGGTGNSSSDASIPTNRRIFWIATGPCVKPGAALTQQVYVYDTAATILWSLGLERSPDLDGRPVCEAFLPELEASCLRDAPPRP